MDGNDALLFAEEVFGIQGAVFHVYRTMGAGFLEAVYQECVQIEFEERRIPFSALRPLRLEYRGRELKTRYAPASFALRRSSSNSRLCGNRARASGATDQLSARHGPEARAARELRTRSQGASGQVSALNFRVFCVFRGFIHADFGGPFSSTVLPSGSRT
jgi:hypothetical protein